MLPKKDTINARIKKVRMKYEYNQSDFAKLLGLKQTSISFLEKDGSTVKESVIKLICKEFNINYNWLTAGAEPMEESGEGDVANKIDDFMSDENETAKAVFKEFSKLDKEEWDMLGEFILNIGKSINENKEIKT